MRSDPAKQQATQTEGRKDEARDLDDRRQPGSVADRDRRAQPQEQAGEGVVRSQDPDFGRGDP